MAQVGTRSAVRARAASGPAIAPPPARAHLVRSLPQLIGQYDSPFVRRVASAMTLYEMPFEHRVWSVFRDAEKIVAFNSLRGKPTLVLPSGEVLVESAAIRPGDLAAR